jgi:ketosteroid isomerase-like protein
MVGLNRGRLGLCALLLVVTAGCSDTASTSASNDQISASDVAAPADSQGERQRLLEADQAFSDTAIDKGIAEAYRQFIASDAVQLPDGGMPLLGGEVIYQNMVTVSAGMEFSLSWQAEDAVVSQHGDLGYTWGNYWYNGFDEYGESFIIEGKYLNIWRKDEQNDWKVVLDMGNENPSLEPDVIDLEGFDYQAITPEELEAENL